MKFFGMQRPEQIHAAVRGLHGFALESNRYPATEEEISKTIEIAKEISKKTNLVEELDEKIARNVISYARCSISPMAAFFGGIVA